MSEHEQVVSPEAIHASEDHKLGHTNPSDNNDPPQTIAKPPTLRPTHNQVAPIMTSSSSPLGAINAARRPGPPPARASGLTSDIQKKMKEMMLSRQGPAAQNARPNIPGAQPPATPHAQPSGPATAIPTGGAITGRSPALGSPASASPRMSPRPGVGPMGGLSAKRKGAGLKLADAQKPAAEGEAVKPQDTGSQFRKYADIVDTQRGTLTFKDKAVIHGSGIDFSSGSAFSISLEEVDTLDELGKGNYGTVFKVRHSRPKYRKVGQGLRGNMQRQISSSQNNSNEESKPTAGTTGLVMAMKELRLELDDAKFAGIIMELDILHRCHSHFIIDFYGAFFQEGSVYMCIEYMDGGSIDKLYHEGVPEGVLRKISLSTVMGLKYLKDDHNIIHRDVKPTNILINTKGQVKICDFGVSGNLVASMARTNIGCQSYMAPERISGGGIGAVGVASSGSYSVQSDIWSLALTIIECALGRYPYPPETYNNIFSQLSAIVDGEPPDLPADKYSEAARDFVKGCLNKIPKLRPTYAMLLRHGWLAQLMKPPTISEDEEAEKAAEAGGDVTADIEPVDLTADKEVADWVAYAMERKKAGKMAISEKPALHAAPLDAVPGSPLMDMSFTDDQPPPPNPGVRINSPELIGARIQGIDFADGVEAKTKS